MSLVSTELMLMTSVNYVKQSKNNLLAEVAKLHLAPSQWKHAQVYITRQGNLLSSAMVFVSLP